MTLPNNPYLALRQQVLNLKPPELGPGATGKLPLIAGMMERSPRLTGLE
jgi:hypothetical protein